MSALTTQWLTVQSASIKAQNGAMDLVSVQGEGNDDLRASHIAAFQAAQDANLTDLDTQIRALQVLLAAL